MDKKKQINSSSKPEPDEVLRRWLEHSWKNHQKSYSAASLAQKESELIFGVLASFKLFIEQLGDNKIISKNFEIIEILTSIQNKLDNTSIGKRYLKGVKDIALGELLICLKFHGIPYEVGRKMVANMSLLSEEKIRKAHEVYKNSFDTTQPNFNIEAQIKFNLYKIEIIKLFKNRDLIADKNHKDYDLHIKAIEKTKKFYE